ncbi:unnamed protein product [Urochloa decumbens]|uniref:Ribosome-inactivating protein n=1 Tax=Urochloa decumbens TaxID=240449 RepID=A0ABC8VZ06_9POAL
MRGRAAALLLLSLLVLGATNKALCRHESPSTTASALAQCPEEEAEDNDDYPKLELSLEGLTDETYGAFIAQLRKMLASGETMFKLAVLRSRASVTMSQRFVLVEITNYAGETIELAVDVVNVYVVGYRVGNDSFFTRPDDDDTKEAITHLFAGTERHMLPFYGSYGSLQEAARANRENIALGASALDDSVRAMNLYATSLLTPMVLHSVARGLIVCIQMISEAARFRHIEREVSSRIRRSVDSEPDPSVIDLENSWGPLSTAIQRSSNDGGVFDTPILLQRRNYSRLVAGDDDDDEPTCPSDVEPTSRIQGPDGLCVDVRDGHYNNGNPVQLWPCKNNDDPNQLWTFRSDGTLRSDGKCLASYGYTSGDYIMIYHRVSVRPHGDDNDVVLRECANMEDAGSWWALYPDGSIRPNQRRSLCLATPDTQPDRPLKTLRCDPSSNLQRWLLENDGTVVSLGTDLVMDVIGSPEPGAHLALNAPAPGTATQEWQPLL